MRRQSSQTSNPLHRLATDGFTLIYIMRSFVTKSLLILVHQRVGYSKSTRRTLKEWADEGTTTTAQVQLSEGRHRGFCRRVKQAVYIFRV